MDDAVVQLHPTQYHVLLNPKKASLEQRKQFARIKKMAKFAKSLHLGVNGGHGLDYDNVSPIAAIKEIDEVSIGYAIMVRAMFVGLEKAVKEMLKLVKRRS